MKLNLTTFGQSQAAVTARDAQYAGTPLTDIPGDGTYADPYLGMNRAGSCAPGIGIGTGSVYLTAAEIAAGLTRPQGWTEEDQFEAARIPQDTQHIGGIVAAAPAYAGVGYPSPAQVGDQPVKIADHAGEDYNDTANFVVATIAAVDGAEADAASGIVNDTGGTLTIGDLIWGRVPVA